MPKKKVFMLIDDDPDDRLFFQEAITKLDATYEYIESDAGHKALDHLKQTESLPDYIFLDLNMPKMSGKEFLYELRKDSKFKDTPVVIYSSSTYNVDMDDTLKLGASHFLSKTSNLSKLPDDIAQAIASVDQNRPS